MFLISQSDIINFLHQMEIDPSRVIFHQGTFSMSSAVGFDIAVAHIDFDLFDGT